MFLTSHPVPHGYLDCKQWHVSILHSHLHSLPLSPSFSFLFFSSDLLDIEATCVSVCVCVRARVRACMRACVCVCVRIISGR